MIYINITSLFDTKKNTGIQRVVVSIVNELLKKEHYKIITFSQEKSAFLVIEHKGEFKDFIYHVPRKCAFSLLRFSDLQPGDFFFDIDSAWVDSVDRLVLYPALKKRMVKIAVMHYDAVPIINQEWTHPQTFLQYLNFYFAKMAYADHVFSISEFAKSEIESHIEQFLGIKKEISVIPMGAFPLLSGGERNDEIQHKYRNILGKPFFLSVGTMEPRKNYRLLVDIFVHDDFIDAPLVIVGRKGWNVDEFIEEMTALPEYGENIFWFNDVTDEELCFLYSKCHAYVTASHYEGYGLPAMEALSFGVPTVVSNGGALPEAVDGTGEIFSLDEPEQLSVILRRLLNSPEYHKELQKRANNYVSGSWDEAVCVINTVFCEWESRHLVYDFFAPVDQAVYISIRPGSFRRSLKSVKENMPFIKEIILLTQETLLPEFASIIEEFGFSYHIITDEDLIRGDENNDALKEHATRNMYLRKKLYTHSKIAANFIAMDDDSIALKLIERKFYQNLNGHKAYYFYRDLLTWKGDVALTSFDRSLIKTGLVLHSLGYPTMAYNSHMPQIINKKLVGEIFNELLCGSMNLGIDEWSTYFNLAYFKFPLIFNPQEYVTLGWPGQASAWVPDIVPDSFFFQNMYDNREDGVCQLVSRDSLLATEYREELLKFRKYELEENSEPVIVFIGLDKIVLLGGELRLTRSYCCLKRIHLQYDPRIGAEYAIYAELYDAAGKSLRKDQFKAGIGSYLYLFMKDLEGTYNWVIELKKHMQTVSSVHIQINVL